mgnify:CR=1 FL=1
MEDRNQLDRIFSYIDETEEYGEDGCRGRYRREES